VRDDADAGDLKDAVCAKLKLDAPPDCVRLLREARRGGGAPVPLDGTQPLARQRVTGGSRILVDIMAAPSLPPPQPPQLLALLEAFPGALVPAPDAALDPALLASLAAPWTPPAQRLSALNALLLAQRCSARSGRPRHALPLFSTQAHSELLEALAAHAGALAAGGFVDSNGSACRTLVGARGTGKTAMLRAFAAVAPSAFPGLTALYLSCQGMEDSQSPLHALPLGAWLSATAQARGAGPPHVHPDAALAASGQRVLVLLDEVDDLYRLSAAYPVAVASARATLGRLSILGSGTSGLYGVLLCGSSASTHCLVSGDASSLGHKFPLAAAGVPNLNCTKFTRLLLQSAHCGASSEVAGMLAALAGQRGVGAELLPQARLLTFFCGTTPRAIVAAALAQRVHGSSSSSSGSSGSGSDGGGSATQQRVPSLTAAQLAAAIPAASLPAGPSSLPGAAPMLLLELLAQLRAANGPLRSLIGCADGSANLVELMSPGSQWEACIVPLQWEQVASAWAKCAGALGLGHCGGDPGVLRRLVDDIADAQVLQVRCSEESGAVEVWPATAAQVVAAGPVPRAWLREAAGRLRPVAGLLSDAASIAGVAAAAVGGVLTHLK
jgi:hypothetical protein